MENYTGIIDEIIYYNEENGYTVGILETEDDIVTFTGIFSNPTQGENLKITGNWTFHRRYGKQFDVDSFELIRPDTLDGIKKYLSSGLIKGIGKSTANKIVELFGDKTLEIMQYQPQRITEVEGIGDKKAEIIIESYREQIELKEIMIYLQKYGISPSYSVKIFRRYGTDTIKNVKDNPYRLAEEIQGIGFKLADKIAAAMGISNNSEFRIEAGIRHVLMESAGDGHTYLSKHHLKEKAEKVLSVKISYIDAVISNMAFRGQLFVENIDESDAIYYIPYYYAETGTANKITSLHLNFKNRFDGNLEEIIEEIERESIKRLTEKQKESVVKAVKNGVSVITGGPGTGKTTVINTLIKVFEIMGKETALCAPTGRATKRITETSNKEAKTIHRLLEYNFSEDTSTLFFNKNEHAPLEYEVIIVDEVSMVDILLMNSLLKAIGTGSRIVLVGDVDQLPSVGAGNVLRDIIESGVIPTTKLDKVFRQSEKSLIKINAHNINNGEMPMYNIKEGDFYFIKEEEGNIADTIVSLCADRLTSHYGFNGMEEIQVLTPMKKGISGTIELNRRLQAALNPPSDIKTEKKIGDVVYRVGDKVMQTKNNYQVKWEIVNTGKETEKGEGIFNGDIGHIRFIDNKDECLWIEFEEKREVKYDFTQLDEIILAYAVTVHKSQGSEFPAVIIPVTWAPPMLLNRNLFYTAVTRAQKLVVLVGNEKYLRLMIQNNKTSERYSGLKFRLSQIKQYY
ncbi:MAG: RecD-like DNA helicase YrrC [Clostridiales bacterium 38_11]|nr:MAG: RecD-like DNA helicase YrrC [Clostridiales bacterium 38_11]HBH13633.1 ATP-dependent RecD-like DNA helicase [Clostridiales bacterium]